MKGKETKSSKIPKGSDARLKQIGARIKTLRIKKGFSSYETFAYEHDLPRAQFGRYEKGQDLRVSSLIKVLNALEISLEEFFSEGFD